MVSAKILQNLSHCDVSINKSIPVGLDCNVYHACNEALLCCSLLLNTKHSAGIINALFSYYTPLTKAYFTCWINVFRKKVLCFGPIHYRYMQLFLYWYTSVHMRYSRCVYFVIIIGNPCCIMDFPTAPQFDFIDKNPPFEPPLMMCLMHF